MGSRGLAGGVSAGDLAQDAIRKFLDGERRWNPAAYPTLLDFLRSVVDSMIWNLTSSDEHGKVRRFPVDRNGMEQVDLLGEGDPEDRMARQYSAAERRPDRVLHDRINETLAERFWIELEQEIQAVEDSQVRGELLQLFRAVEQAPPDYAGLVVSSGIPADRIYRRFYRLEKLAARVARRLLGGPNSGATVLEAEVKCHAS